MKKQHDFIIIGAGLTGLTLAFYLKRAGKSVLILEKENRTGGVMLTTEKDGFVFETGPNSGSMGSVEMAELFENLGEACQLEVANAASKDRWIWKDGQWHSIPNSLISAIKTPLFTFSDKLRILGEPFRKKGDNPMESLADMVRRRMGNSFLDYAVDPFIGGIYAGNPEQLVTQYAMPKLYNLEQDFDSFVKGTIQKAKQKTERDKKATKEVFTTKGGIQNLINALTEAIGHENIILGADDIQVTPLEEGYEAIANGKKHTSSKVISTCGAKPLPQLFPFIPQKDITPISNLRYAKVVQAVVGYKRWTGKPLAAFGGLIPSKEKRNTLGILFPSSIFTNRAPEGGVLMTIFIGGIKHPEIYDMPDDEIKTIALNEISETLNCNASPDLLEIARYATAIPQYDATSKERLEAITRIEKQYQGLILAGNIRDGIGMSDRVKQAKLLADILI